VRLSLIVAALLLALAPSARGAQSRGAARAESLESKPSYEGKPSEAFTKADGVPADSPKAFEFTLGRFSYRIKANGNGSRSKGSKSRGFNLRLGPGEEITYLYFADYKGGLLLVCEVRGEHGGTSYATRLDQPSMRARWTSNIPATSTGEPARDGSRLYVTGRDFAGAFDIEKGELLWLLDKFPGGAEEFQAFDAPVPRGREVLFRTRPVYNGSPKTVVVDVKTGKVVRVE
jgi:hypothetical protein